MLHTVTLLAGPAYQVPSVGKLRPFVSAFCTVEVLGFHVVRCGEHNRNQFYQSYWPVNYTSRFVSHTGLKIELLKLMNTSSYQLFFLPDCFTCILKCQFFFEKHSSCSYKNWKRRKWLNSSHSVPSIARYTAISTYWDPHVGRDLDVALTFWITVSQLTQFLTCNQRLSSTVLSSQPHFSSNGAPNDTEKNN